MKFTFLIGVDMGKKSFNYCVRQAASVQMQEGVVKNDTSSILTFVDKLKASLAADDLSCCVLCLEHTGIYNAPLIHQWLAIGGQISVIAAHKISTLLAGDQGWDEKNDFIDARRIAEYGIRFADKLTPYKLKNNSLVRLGLLHRQRRRLLDAKHVLETPAAEAEDFLTQEEVALMNKHQQSTIQAMASDLNEIERTMDSIIKDDEELNTLYKQIISVEGVGPVTAREILIATEAFTKFTPDQAKSFARYAGVTPKDWSSGTSVRKRVVSKRANQRIKSLLTQGARAVATTKGELGIYYRRKRAQGKPFLSVINAIRNKIILRVFAVVRNQVMYEKNLNLCLDNP
jgi:transposase